MPDFEFKDRADFQRMVDSQIEETLTLEYKASPAISRESQKVAELCKDVSAMANSAGGQIVYGIEEDRKTHKPSKVDEGVTDEKVTREWLQQILTSNIHPRLQGLSVQRVLLSENGYGYVISVEPTVIGPHQSLDKKYYRRFELESKPMEDYEVRDIMRRATTPDLRAVLSFPQGNELVVQFAPHKELSQAFFLDCTIINKAPTPAHYAIVEVMIDADLANPFSVDPFVRSSVIDKAPEPRHCVFRRTIAAPPGVPIFMEGIHDSHRAQIALQLPSSLLNSSLVYLATRLMGPGVSREERWGIYVRSGLMKLLPPNHPMLS